MYMWRLLVQYDLSHLAPLVSLQLQPHPQVHRGQPADRGGHPAVLLPVQEGTVSLLKLRDGHAVQDRCHQPAQRHRQEAGVWLRPALHTQSQAGHGGPA